MNKTEQLPIYLKTYQFIKLMYGVIKNFPKHYKYSLGEDIIKILWQCLDIIPEVNLLPNNEKYIKILELSQVFDKLKPRLRMSQELNLISKNQYSHIVTNYSLEIGKMIGAWMKWSSPKTLKTEEIYE